MSAPFQFTPQTTEDLDEIWSFIAQDSVDAANRVEAEIATCHRLARYPLIETSDRDEALRHYSPASKILDRYEIPKLRHLIQARNGSLAVVAVLHGKRDLGEILDDRLK
jgi:plasmid stabilization system protein ParE